MAYRSIWRGRSGFIYVLEGGKPNFLDRVIISAFRQLAVDLPAGTSSLDYLNPVIPNLSALHVHNWGCEDSRALSAGRNLRELTLQTKDKFPVRAEGLSRLETLECEWNEHLAALLQLPSLRSLTLWHATPSCFEKIEADLDELIILMSRKIQSLPHLRNVTELNQLRIAGPVQFDATSLGVYNRIGTLFIQGVQRISGLVEASRHCQFDVITIEGVRRMIDSETLPKLRATRVQLEMHTRDAIPGPIREQLLASQTAKWEIYP
jgi:hypothetical protein